MELYLIIPVPEIATKGILEMGLLLIITTKQKRNLPLQMEAVQTGTERRIEPLQIDQALQPPIIVQVDPPTIMEPTESTVGNRTK